VDRKWHTLRSHTEIRTNQYEDIAIAALSCLLQDFTETYLHEIKNIYYSQFLKKRVRYNKNNSISAELQFREYK
jgi:hypothetical protein